MTSILPLEIIFARASLMTIEEYANGNINSLSVNKVLSVCLAKIFTQLYLRLEDRKEECYRLYKDTILALKGECPYSFKLFDGKFTMLVLKCLGKCEGGGLSKLPKNFDRKELKIDLEEYLLLRKTFRAIFTLMGLAGIRGKTVGAIRDLEVVEEKENGSVTELGDFEKLIVLDQVKILLGQGKVYLTSLMEISESCLMAKPVFQSICEWHANIQSTVEKGEVQKTMQGVKKMLAFLEVVFFIPSRIKEIEEMCGQYSVNQSRIGTILKKIFSEVEIEETKWSQKEIVEFFLQIILNEISRFQQILDRKVECPQMKRLVERIQADLREYQEQEKQGVDRIIQEWALQANQETFRMWMQSKTGLCKKIAAIPLEGQEKAFSSICGDLTKWFEEIERCPSRRSFSREERAQTRIEESLQSYGMALKRTYILLQECLGFCGLLCTGY